MKFILVRCGSDIFAFDILFTQACMVITLIPTKNRTTIRTTMKPPIWLERTRWAACTREAILIFYCAGIQAPVSPSCSATCTSWLPEVDYIMFCGLFKNYLPALFVWDRWCSSRSTFSSTIAFFSYIQHGLHFKLRYLHVWQGQQCGGSDGFGNERSWDQRHGAGIRYAHLLYYLVFSVRLLLDLQTAINNTLCGHSCIIISSPALFRCFGAVWQRHLLHWWVR